MPLSPAITRKRSREVCTLVIARVIVRVIARVAGGHIQGSWLARGAVGE